MKIHHGAIALLAAGMLSACGGGGSSDPATEQSAGTQTPTGAGGDAVNSPTSAMVARFQPGEDHVAILRGRSSVSTMSKPTVEQRDDGAMVNLSGASLAGTAVVRDIHSDVDSALGRWAGGTVTPSASSTPSTFTEDDPSYHYVVVNRLAALPTAGSPRCDSGAFTAPSYESGGTAAAVSRTGSATGTASVAIDATGVTYNLKIDVTTPEGTGTRTGSKAITSPTSVSIVGNNLVGADAMVVFGSAKGTDAYLLAGTYSAVLPSGAKYVGAFRFRCA